MTSLYLIADLLGAYLSVHRRLPCNVADDARRWYAHFDNCEIDGGGVLIGATGNGPTPADAIADYCREIAGKPVIFHAHTPSLRREFTMPRDLEEPPHASAAREGLRERAVRLWRDGRTGDYHVPGSHGAPDLPPGRTPVEYVALPAADMERLLAADALTRDAVVAVLQTFCERFDIDYIDVEQADVDACEQASRAALRPEGEKGVTPC